MTEEFFALITHYKCVSSFEAIVDLPHKRRRRKETASLISGE